MEKSKEEKIKKSLFYSIVDGSFWSVMFGAGERYLSAFAVFLKANNIQLGLLTSLPILFGSLCQFFSLKLMDAIKSRKKFVVISALIQAFTWLPILLVFYFGELKIYYLIFFAVIYWISGMIAVPAWNSWMGDLVDQNTRGFYFGKRSKITGLIILVSTVLAGIVLELFRDGADRQYIGFIIIFIAALVSRLASALFLSKKYEPEMVKVKTGDEFGFIEFLKQARFRNYGLFVIFLTFMNFAIYIAAPFFVAYMLYDLKLSYASYMILISVSILSKYVSLPAWGKLSDKYGNKKILTLTGYLMPALPLLWAISTNFYYLIAIELYGGLVWAGFELSSFNFVFDTTTPQKRARCVSYFNVLNGIMIFIGTTIGSLIVKYNSVFWTKYYLVFILSGVLRYAASFYFLPKLKEARKVANISYNRIFLKATDMIITESFNNVTFLLSYPKKFRLVKRKRLWSSGKTAPSQGANPGSNRRQS